MASLHKFQSRGSHRHRDGHHEVPLERLSENENVRPDHKENCTRSTHAILRVDNLLGLDQDCMAVSPSCLQCMACLVLYFSGKLTVNVWTDHWVSHNLSRRTRQSIGNPLHSGYTWSEDLIGTAFSFPRRVGRTRCWKLRYHAAGSQSACILQHQTTAPILRRHSLLAHSASRTPFQGIVPIARQSQNKHDDLSHDSQTASGPGSHHGHCRRKALPTLIQEKETGALLRAA